MIFGKISVSIAYFEAKSNFEETCQIHIAATRRITYYFSINIHTLGKMNLYFTIIAYTCILLFIHISENLFICYY